MRTASPFVTWSRMTLCGPSATSLSISTPRLIGPGCITRQLGLSFVALALGQAEESNVLVQVREIFLTLAFVLNSQQVNNVGRFQDIVDMTRHLDAHLLEGTWYKSARARLT